MIPKQDQEEPREASCQKDSPNCPCCGALMKEAARNTRSVTYKCPECGLSDAKLTSP